MPQSVAAFVIQEKPLVMLPYTVKGRLSNEAGDDLVGDGRLIVGDGGEDDDLRSQQATRTTTLVPLPSEMVLLDEEVDDEEDDCISVQSRSPHSSTGTLLAALEEEFSSRSSMSDIHIFDGVVAASCPALFLR